jgi:hypothetical protein
MIVREMVKRIEMRKSSRFRSIDLGELAAAVNAPSMLVRELGIARSAEFHRSSAVA